MSTTPLVYKYPYDPTGVNASNLVSAEKHTVPREETRAFATLAGPFFTESLVVKDATGKLLAKKTDYVAFEYVADPSEITGKEVCCAILIKNSAISGDIFVTYQAVGGPFSLNVEAITQAIANLEIDARTVAWGDILAKPDYFPPLRHLHDIGDVYGFEYIVNAIEDLRNAILNGDSVAHSAILRRIDDLRSWVNQRLVDTVDIVEEHQRDASNPHKTDKNQIGLGQVQNYPIATDQQAMAGTANNAYMTPLLVAKYVSYKASDALLAHIADKSNPHGVDKAQIGLGLVQNYGMATLLQAAEGTSQLLYVSPMGVTKRIDTMVMPTLNQHIGNQNNPHGTGKGHVGLGNVDNYRTATPAEALLSTTADKFMTPALVHHILANYSKFVDNDAEHGRIWAEIAKLQAIYNAGKQTTTSWAIGTSWGTQVGTTIATVRDTDVLVPAGPDRTSSWTSTWTTAWNSIRNTSVVTAIGSSWTTNWSQQTSRATATSAVTNWYSNTSHNTYMQQLRYTDKFTFIKSNRSTSQVTGKWTAKWFPHGGVAGCEGHYTQAWTKWATVAITNVEVATYWSGLTQKDVAYQTTWTVPKSKTTTWNTNTAWSTGMSQQTSVSGTRTTDWTTSVAVQHNTNKATSVVVPGGAAHYSTKQTSFDTTWNTGRTTSQQTQYQRQTTTAWS